jgi:3-methylfumaryl-CoA hydratase
MSAISPDGQSFADWIGRSRQRTDVLTARIADEYRATLAPHLAELPGAPLGSHWALAPEIEAAAELGPDGHPRLGLHLPPLPFARRMWAGGELRLEAPLQVGDEVVKTSVIEDIAFKSGATGPLAFVTMRHAYEVKGKRVISERQDIVYRTPSGEAGKPTLAPSAEPLASFTVEATPTLLFRYSAFTFNGHRIHYDLPYATGVEGYAGLVVHGPMQAALMLNAAAMALGHAPASFRYRGLSPLIAGAPFRIEAMRAEGGGMTTRVVSSAGAVTMSGAASVG